MKSINITYPIEDNPEKNTLFRMNNVTKDALVSNLTLLFKTKRGQRYYKPDYGTNLERNLFEPQDGITEEDIISDLKEAVRKYMPNVSVDNVLFFNNTDEGYEDLKETEISVRIFFTYSEDAFTSKGSIDITF